MGWIKFSKREPKQGEGVLVRFGNGREIIGKRQGNWMVYPPKDLDAKTFMSKAIEWFEE